MEFVIIRLNASTENHLRTLGLRHMPANMREMNGQHFKVAPNKDSYVFVKVKTDAPSVVINDDFE